MDSSPCVIWTGFIQPNGYARTRRSEYAHRVAYEAAHGPIPLGLEIDHLCRTRACVNPAHMEAVTHAENMRRARRATCRNGHTMEGDNVLTDSRGKRRCRSCSRARAVVYYRDRKGG